MAGQKLALTITLDGKTRTIRDLREIQQLINQSANIPDIKTPGVDRLLTGLPRIAFAYNEISQAVQRVLAQVRPLYDLLIGSNEQLNRGLLQSAATIAATSRVVQNGIDITNPVEAIEALQPELKKAIKEVELATLELIGVTSRQTSEVFNVILSQASALNGQFQALDGSGQKFASSIDAAAAIAPGLVATLGTLNLPIGQAADEINNLLRGEIDRTAQVATRLGITKDEIERLKAQGQLTDGLVKRFEAFVAANKLGARSVSGITSNIQDLVEIAGRAAGEPLLETLVDQLDRVYQFLKLNQDEITQQAQDAVAVISQLIDTTITALDSIIQAIRPSLEVIGEALSESFEAGAVVAGDTIENLGQLIALLVELSQPFVELLGNLFGGLAQIASTDAGRTLIQFGIAATVLNASIPRLVGGINGLFTAVGALERTFNNLIPLLAQTNAGKALLTARETQLAFATGTSTAAMNAQAVARARMTAGDFAGAAAALQVAAAEQAKSIALRQSTLALAANVAKFGLLAGAIASVAIAINQFQEITEEARKTAAGVEDIQKAIADVDEAIAKVNETNAKGAAASAEAIERNIQIIQGALNPVSQIIDQVINFINSGIDQINQLLDSPIVSLIPGLREVKSNLDALGIDAIPRLSTAAEAAVTQAQNSFNDLEDSVSEVLQRVGTITRDAEGKYQFPDLAGRSKEEIESYVEAVNSSVAALEASRPTQQQDLKFKQQNLEVLKALQTQLENTAGATDIQSKKLQDQGTIYQVLQKQVENATRTLNTSGDQTQVDQAAEQLVQLTQQQLELGTITQKQARDRLAAIAANGAIEVKTRQAAVDAIAKIEDGLVEKSGKAYQQRAQEIARLEAEGVIRSDEAERQRTASTVAELQNRLKFVQAAIVAEQQRVDDGRGSQQRLNRLKEQEAQIFTEVAEAAADAERAVYQQRLNEIERQQELANAAIAESESQRQIEIQQLLNEGVISQRDAEAEKLDATQQRLAAELAAEEDKLTQLASLPNPDDPEEAEANQRLIRQSRQRTAELTLQLLENEYQQQERLRQIAVAAIDARIDRLRTAAEIQQNADAEQIRQNTAQDAALQRQVSAEQRITTALGNQQKLLTAQSGLRESLQSLAQTRAKLEIDGLTETLQLQERLRTEQSGQIRNVIQQRLTALGVLEGEQQIQEKIAKQTQEQAQIEFRRLIQKQRLDQITLVLQQQQEESQNRLALLEARRNELAAQRQRLEAQSASNAAERARTEAQAELEKAALVQDPQERETATNAAQRAILAAEREAANANQGSELADQSLELAREQTAQAEQAFAIQERAADFAERALLAQQASERALAAQTRDSAVFAANLQLAEQAAARTSRYLSGVAQPDGSIPGRRTGGDIQPGQVYKVHKDELFVSASGGYMLNRRDAMRVAQESLGTGVSAASVGTVGRSAGDPLLSAISSLQRTLSGMGGGGPQIGTVYQSVYNQVPRSEAALAKMVEQSQFGLLRSLQRKLREY